MGSNPTASASSISRTLLVLGAAMLSSGCLYFANVPGETRTEGTKQHAVSKRVLELAEAAQPQCRSRKVTDSELVDLYGDGKVAIERWTVTQCGQRSRYLVNFPATGRGTGFSVHADK